MNSIPYLGEILALLTAIAWSFAVILFKKSGETVHPVALNLFKNVLAMTLLLPTMYLFGETLILPAPKEDYLLVLISGALGIGICDTLFFKSLNLVGAGMSAIIDCLYSPLTIGLSVLWLGEQLTLLQMIGVMVILSAVFIAGGRKGNTTASLKDLVAGIIYGVLAIAAMAVGVVMIKPLLEHSPLFWVVEMRLIGGLIVLGCVLSLHPKRRSILRTLAPGQGWKYTVSASFVGTYLALVLWIAGMKFGQVSVVAALNQTSNVFIFIFAAIFLHESISLRRAVAIFLGVTGSLLVTFS